MRWPLVWRRRLLRALSDQAAASEAQWHLDQETAWLREQLAAERARYDALLDRYHELASPAKPAAAATAQPVEREQKRDIVLDKIREEAGGDSRLAAHYQRVAADLRRAGKTPEEIVLEIGWTTESPAGVD